MVSAAFQGRKKVMQAPGGFLLLPATNAAEMWQSERFELVLSTVDDELSVDGAEQQPWE